MSSKFALALMAGASIAILSAPVARAAEDEQVNDQVRELVVRGIRQNTPASAEAVSADEIATTVNAVNIEDTVKYLPSLIVRKRHIGDTQAPLGTRTSGLGASARTLIYADGVLLSALIGNNNSTASPRWGMVAPDEVQSVSFLYGPFAAPYAGNSIGGVLEIATRTPDALEGSFHALGSWQSFDQYATEDQYRSGQVSASIGDRIGNFWFRFSGNAVESNSQPLSYITATRSGAGGAAVTGAFTGVNRAGAPIAIFGAGGLEHQVQTNLKLRAGYEFPAFGVAYMAGRFSNNTDATVQAYARTGAGAPFYTGTANVAGFNYTLAASAFSNGVYARDDEHWMHSLTLASRGDGAWTWRLTASLYDYARDQQRTPTTALPGAFTGGAGNIARMDGTGWRNLDGHASRTIGGHTLSLGLHGDETELNSSRYTTVNWISGAAGALNQQSLGRTRTGAVWAQDVVDLREDLKLTVGVRAEDWKASGGYNYSLAPALAVTQPVLSATRTSPKVALEWKPAEGWSIAASYGEAYRFPTVTELYQAITTGVTLTSPNPTLRPEHARSAELAVERTFAEGRLRASLFTEDISDALLSQSALVPGTASVASFVQNVDRTRADGLEFVAERSNAFIKGLDLSASLTLTDPETRRDTALPAAAGKQLPGVPKVKAVAVATWRPDERWAWTLAARYSSRLYATIDNTDVVTHTYQGFDPFVVVDARVTYKVNEQWQAALGVDNINDHRYFLFHPFPGRTITAEINYRF